jgi:hypothetical protein
VSTGDAGISHCLELLAFISHRLESAQGNTVLKKFAA